MSEEIIIGIDAGTSVIKSVAFSTRGEQLAVAAIANHYKTLKNGGVEQDMARTWKDAAQTLRDLADKIDNLNSRVIAIAVTGQGDGMWLIDKEGEPAAPPGCGSMHAPPRSPRTLPAPLLTRPIMNAPAPG